MGAVQSVNPVDATLMLPLSLLLAGRPPRGGEGAGPRAVDPHEVERRDDLQGARRTDLDLPALHYDPGGLHAAHG